MSEQTPDARSLQLAIERLAPRSCIAGSCGTPYCSGWVAEVRWVDGRYIVQRGCPCGSEDGWDTLADFLLDCEKENEAAADRAAPPAPLDEAIEALRLLVNLLEGFADGTLTDGQITVDTAIAIRDARAVLGDYDARTEGER